MVEEWRDPNPTWEPMPVEESIAGPSGVAAQRGRESTPGLNIVEPVPSTSRSTHVSTCFLKNLSVYNVFK